MSRCKKCSSLFNVFIHLAVLIRRAVTTEVMVLLNDCAAFIRLFIELFQDELLGSSLTFTFTFIKVFFKSIQSGPLSAEMC